MRGSEPSTGTRRCTITGGSSTLLVLGRTGVDLYPTHLRTRLEDEQTFIKYVSGSPTNVAIAAATLGIDVGLISRVGDDPFGRFVTAELLRLGVSTQYVEPVPGRLTPVAFCEMFPPSRFPLYFYRDAGAPDLQITPDSLDMNAVSRAGFFWTTLTGLSADPSRSAHLAAWTARECHGNVFDLDYRAALWPSRDEARMQAQAALAHVDIAIGNEEECELVTGESTPDRMAEVLLAAGVRLAVVKRGAAGVYVRTDTAEYDFPGISVTVVNGLGSGDAFGGALVAGLAWQWDIERAVAYANTAGALAAMRHGCSDMPKPEEIALALYASRMRSSSRETL